MSGGWLYISSVSWGSELKTSVRFAASNEDACFSSCCARIRGDGEEGADVDGNNFLYCLYAGECCFLGLIPAFVGVAG